MFLQACVKVHRMALKKKRFTAFIQEVLTYCREEKKQFRV